MLSTRPFAKNEYVENHRRGKNPEKTLEDAIREWIGGKRIQPNERIIQVNASPGIGKSWLLKHLEEKQNGVYLDLTNRRDYGSAQSFIQEQKLIIENSNNPSKYGQLLLVDHVPESSGADDYTDKFEDDILCYGLHNANNMFIIAVHDKSSWPFSGAIPQSEVQSINGFDRDNRNWQRNFSKLRNWEWYQEQLLNESDEHIPMLLDVVCRSDSDNLIETVQEFLEYWLQRKTDFSEERWEHAILLGSILAWLENPIDNILEGNKLMDLVFNDSQSSHSARLLLKKVGWVEEQYLSSDLVEKNWLWVSPVRAALLVWLNFKHNDIFVRCKVFIDARNKN